MTNAQGVSTKYAYDEVGNMTPREANAKRMIEEKIDGELITIPKTATPGEVMEILRNAGLIP